MFIINHVYWYVCLKFFTRFIFSSMQHVPSQSTIDSVTEQMNKQTDYSNYYQLQNIHVKASSCLQQRVLTSHNAGSGLPCHIRPGWCHSNHLIPNSRVHSRQIQELESLWSKLFTGPPWKSQSNLKQREIFFDLDFIMT